MTEATQRALPRRWERSRLAAAPPLESLFLPKGHHQEPPPPPLLLLLLSPPPPSPLPPPEPPPLRPPPLTGMAPGLPPRKSLGDAALAAVKECLRPCRQVLEMVHQIAIVLIDLASALLVDTVRLDGGDDHNRIGGDHRLAHRLGFFERYHLKRWPEPSRYCRMVRMVAILKRSQ